MYNIIRYAGVNAKVKALLGKMLQEKDYKELLSLDSVQKVFEYLNEHTFYQNYLQELAGQEIHRRQLERTLKQNLVNDYQVIMPYLTGFTRQFFKFFFTKFEIEELKMLLRTILVERDKEYLQQNLVYLGARYDIAIEELIQIDNYDDLLSIFSGTHFYNILQKFEERYKEDNNLFPVEMTLDFQYFSHLGKLAQRLSESDHRIVRELLGTKMDLLNINFIYRIKRFYNLELEQILNHILPYHYRLTIDELKQMAKLEEADEIFDFIAQTDYDEVFNKFDKDRSVLFEKIFLSYLLQKAIHIKIKGDFSIGVIMGYLFIKEYEIRDIITIVEGIRYQLSEEEIRKYLIRDWV